MTRLAGAAAFAVLALSGGGVRAQAAAPPPAPDARAQCEALKGGAGFSAATARFAAIPDAPTSIVSATVVPADPERGVPERCMVEGQIAPQIGFLLEMPTADWNGKLIMGGCGGPCGGYNSSLDPALARHYAVVGTNMGHKGVGWIFAYQNLQAQVDFGTRSTHLTAVVSKDILDAFYSRPPRYAYFSGCSTGGRQAMVEAQRFPEDFNGIIGGAPPYFETGDTPLFLSWGARANIDAAGKPILDAAKLPMIHAAVMKDCGRNGGAVGDVLLNPMTCGWRPSAIACKAGETGAACLTPAEIGVVEEIYGGARTSKGRKLYWGMPRGSELNWTPGFLNTGGKPGNYLAGFAGPGNSIMTYASYFYSPGPKYKETDFNYDTDVPKLAVIESLYNAQNPDLRAFKATGGKFILYHGWNDNQIPAGASVDYYETATRTMGGATQTTDFFRLFMLPSVGHCLWGVGGSEVDWLTALESWVEKGQAPDQVLAHHMKVEPYPIATVGQQRVLRGPKYPLDPASYDTARPVYAYPGVAKWSGRGDPADPSTWARAR